MNQRSLGVGDDYGFHGALPFAMMQYSSICIMHWHAHW